MDQVGLLYLMYTETHSRMKPFSCSAHYASVFRFQHPMVSYSLDSGCSITQQFYDIVWNRRKVIGSQTMTFLTSLNHKLGFLQEIKLEHIFI